MIGAIIGDTVGSIYEFQNIKKKDFPLFGEGCGFTDDSVLSVATADWLLNGGDVAEYYTRYGLKYPHPHGGYGPGFRRWLMAGQYEGAQQPYNSCGNGSAMRISAVGWCSDDLDEVLAKAKESAECTHNHPEGIKGAQATALCILMARKGASKAEIEKEVTERFEYDLNFTTDEIRPIYGWSCERFPDGCLCQGSVPQAIRAFLDGNDYEDCIRNAVSIGGDSDTIACITGGIAEAFYGVPRKIYEEGLSYLDDDLRSVVEAFEAKYGNKIID